MSTTGRDNRIVVRCMSGILFAGVPALLGLAIVARSIGELPWIVAATVAVGVLMVATALYVARVTLRE